MKALATRTILVWISLAVVSLLFTGLSHARIDPKTLVGLWVFDEEDTEVAEDLSENKIDGQINGDSNWEDGKFGKALEYDGSTVCVEVPDLSSHVIDGFTVCFWLNKVDQDLDNRWLFGSYSGWASGSASFLIWKDEDNRNNLIFGVQGKKGARGTCSYADLTSEEWNHIAASYDKSQVKLYVNGVQVSSANFTEEVSSSATPWYIGYSPGHQIQGFMDEVAIFNIALTEDNIKSIMNEGLERVLGITAIDLSGKLTTTWASIKK